MLRSISESNEPRQEPVSVHAISNESIINIHDPQYSEQFEQLKTTINALLDKNVLAAIEKNYGSPMNFFSAFFDGLYVEDEFSWREIILLIAALVLGGLVSIFVVYTAGTAASIVAQTIKSLSGYNMPAVTVLKFVLLISATAEAAAIGALSGEKFMQYYFGKKSAEEKELQIVNATRLERFVQISLKIIYLLLAVANNAIVFFMIKSIALALLSASSGIAISWKGLTDLTKSLWRVHPARKAELAILLEELDRFSRLSDAQQQIIMRNIAAIKSKNISDDEKLRELHLCFLTLSKVSDQPVNDTGEAGASRSIIRATINVATGVACAGAEVLTFAIPSGISVNQLFKHPGSAGPIALGAGVTALALPASSGFGYSAGSQVFAHEAPLASRYKPYLYTTLTWTIHSLSAVSGSLLFTLGYNTANFFVTKSGIKNAFAWVLKIAVPAYCYTANALENDVYAMGLLDEIYTYFARRCADTGMRRTLAFTHAARQCYQVLASMNDDNYFRFLNFKLADDTPLAAFMHAELKKRMGDTAYRELLEHDLPKYSPGRTDNAPVPLRQESLSKRLWCRLFGGGESNPDNVPDLELGLRH